MITKGLTYKFLLTSGAFTLKNDVTKVEDNLFFFMSFDFTPRIYTPDFSPNLAWLQQKAASVFIIFRGLILGGLKNKFKKFVPEMIVDSMNITTNRATKEYGILVNYKTTSTDELIKTVVKFI